MRRADGQIVLLPAAAVAWPGEITVASTGPVASGGLAGLTGTPQVPGALGEGEGADDARWQRLRAWTRQGVPRPGPEARSWAERRIGRLHRRSGCAAGSDDGDDGDDDGDATAAIGRKPVTGNNGKTGKGGQGGDKVKTTASDATHDDRADSGPDTHDRQRRPRAPAHRRGQAGPRRARPARPVTTSDTRPRSTADAPAPALAPTGRHAGCSPARPAASSQAGDAPRHPRQASQPGRGTASPARRLLPAPSKGGWPAPTRAPPRRQVRATRAAGSRVASPTRTGSAWRASRAASPSPDGAPRRPRLAAGRP